MNQMTEAHPNGTTQSVETNGPQLLEDMIDKFLEIGESERMEADQYEEAVEAPQEKDSEKEEEEEEAEEDDEEDDEGVTNSDEEHGRVALCYDVNQLTNGGDGLPQNGHDYLRLVQTERDKYPAVLSCALIRATPSDQESHKTTPHSNEVVPHNKGQLNNNNRSAQKPGIINDESYELRCCDEILVNFRKLRSKIEAVRRNKSPSERHLTKEELKRESERCEESADNLLKLMELGKPPQLSSLIDKNQLEIHMTLERMADHYEMMPNYSASHNDWIYSLMAVLREPIEPDICSSLRRLAKLCVHKNKEDTSGLLIICIVRHYFGQSDLRYKVSGAESASQSSWPKHDPA